MIKKPLNINSSALASSALGRKRYQDIQIWILFPSSYHLTQNRGKFVLEF
jgi:hypothetical protein